MKKGPLYVIAGGSVFVALSTSAMADVEIVRRGNTISLYNPYDYTVVCQVTYDMPNGIGGFMGDRRAVHVSPGRTTDAVSGAVYNFYLERCRRWP